ncbi:hypothetical protein M426DRAFT_325725 [Hypoxylon sp. CI-4A]|nr:hypothetical protein M426DRAFT_325725 [Hypoxylon sp. CI-4A]
MDVAAVPKEGIRLGIYITSAVLVILSVVVVALRVYVRWFEKTFWWDDGLMLGGLLCFNVSTGFACRGVYYGVGVQLDGLTDGQQKEARMYIAFFILAYTVSLLLVKLSISMTLLRLTISMCFTRIAVYVTLVLSVVSFCISIISYFALCHPYEAYWDSRLLKGDGATCVTDGIRLGITYVLTAITIATDISCAVLPAVILWGLQLRLKTKILVGTLLSFGSFASICTIVRIRYIRYYTGEELMYWVAYVVLWSLLETAVGLIAGSIPVLQRLIFRRIKSKTSETSPNVEGLVTFGSIPIKSRSDRRGLSDPTQICLGWEPLEDASSSRGIYADCTYDIELTQTSASHSGQEGTKT